MNSSNKSLAKDFFKLNLLAFGITGLWQSIHSYVLPMRILDLVDVSKKSTYLSILTFCGMVIGILTQPLIGRLSDVTSSRFGRRKPYIAIGILLMLLSLTFFGTAGSYLTIFIAYCFLQLSSNTAQTATQALLPEKIEVSHRGKASSVKSFLEVLGGALMVLISPFIMDQYAETGNIKYFYLTLVVCGTILVITGLLTLILVDEPPLSVTIADSRPNFSDFFRIKWSRNLKLLVGSRFFIFMASTTLQQFALYYIQDVLKSQNAAGSFIFIIASAGAGMLIFTYPAGVLSDKIGNKRVSLAGSMTGLLALVFILLMPKTTVFLLIGAFFMGAAIGLFNPANWAMANSMIIEGNEALYLGIAAMASTMGGACSRNMGPLIDYFNAQSVNSGYNVMFIGIIVYMLIGMTILLKIKSK